MTTKQIWEICVRISFSLIFAGCFHLGWMSSFILATRLNNSILNAVLWLLAPVIIASGFTVGIMVFERVFRKSRTKFLKIYLYPLIGCVIGAASLYWIGPMLIVFGMFGLGTVSIFVRELLSYSTRFGERRHSCR